MVCYKNEVDKYLNLDALGKDISTENALFYYSLFNSKMYEDDSISDLKSEEIKEKLNECLNKVGSKKKDLGVTLEEIFSGKDTVTCLLLARRLREKKFLVDVNSNYKGLEVDLFNNENKIAIELKRVYSTNNFYKEMIDTNNKYKNKNLTSNKIFLIFLLPCKDNLHVNTINRATIGFKSFIEKYKTESKLLNQFNTLIYGFSPDSSVNNLSEDIIKKIKFKTNQINK